MGSPNFRTDNDFVLNVGIESDCTDVDDYLMDDLSYQIAESEKWYNNLNQIWFHTIETEPGYHSGYQIMIKPLCENSDDMFGFVKAWQDYKEFYTKEGYQAELSDCPYFRKGIKNLTMHNLKQAIAREENYLYNSLLKHASENGLGIVVGLSWTSHVCYQTLQELIKQVKVK